MSYNKIYEFMTPQLIKLTQLTLKHIREPNETLILENCYKRKSESLEAMKLDV